MRRLWLLAPLVLIAGCVDKERAPVLGMWTGGFYTDEAEVLRGYLQLYRTGDKFKMRLTTKQQEMNFEGTWSIAKERITLRVADIKFENPSDETRKALGLKIFDPEQIRSAYSKAITLDVGPNELKGLTLTLGQIQGRHKFTKGARTPGADKAMDRIQGK
jgi:hypothetical protein